MKNSGRCAYANKERNESKRILLTIVFGTILGFLIGVSFPALSLTGLNINKESLIVNQSFMDHTKIWAPLNPKGAEVLPPKIVVSESDFFFRRLWGEPSEDLTSRPKYLVTFTVSYNKKNNVDAAVKKFSDDFTIVLFHYDGRTTEWDEFEWSKRAIHVSVRNQTKWWFAKRFLHPDIIASYEYIFIWDEDLGVENFNAEEYIRLVKKHELEISQPAFEPVEGYWIAWEMTKRISNLEVHKETREKPEWCFDPHLPPCAAFVEMMAPVFSRDSWRCVWHMIQNDLVHGWGLNLALQRCVVPAHEKIGVVDAQPVLLQRMIMVSTEGIPKKGNYGKKAVNERCSEEEEMFTKRLHNAEKAYYEVIGMEPSI